ncbi:hypothetical protein R3W88_016356 [Solanum pinnatisectum]|uniref:Uncharacterized protein n=1 Tax=Solanum pinnatisectum TaxID=50273 RepID=A0AAV9KYJ4_9SOLN|nr:hypothetical protein R3W88_016356 [Solanum pinnatisectum]
MDRSPEFGSISDDNCPMKTRFRYGSQRRRLYCSPTTPFSRFRLLPFRSPLLRNRFAFFSSATKMFDSPVVSVAHGFSSDSKGCPIRESRIYAYFQLSSISPTLRLPRLSALYRLSSRVGDKRTRTADIRRRVNHRLSGPPTDSTIEANDRQ